MTKVHDLRLGVKDVFGSSEGGKWTGGGYRAPPQKPKVGSRCTGNSRRQAGVPAFSNTLRSVPLRERIVCSFLLYAVVSCVVLGYLALESEQLGWGLKHPWLTVTSDSHVMGRRKSLNLDASQLKSREGLIRVDPVATRAVPSSSASARLSASLLHRGWEASPLPSSSSSSLNPLLLRHPSDFSCLLLLPNVCYAFSPSTASSFGSQRSGIWFSQDPAHDLASLNLSSALCDFPSTLRRHEKSINYTLYTTDDLQDLQQLPKRIGQFVGWSDAMDYVAKGGVKEERNVVAEEASRNAAGDGKEETEKQKKKEVEQKRAWEQEEEIDEEDFGSSGTVVLKEVVEEVEEEAEMKDGESMPAGTNSTGTKASVGGGGNDSFAAAPGQSKLLPAGFSALDVAVVPMRDSHLGHFVECLGGLAEVGKHLFKEGIGGGGAGGAAAGRDTQGGPVLSEVTAFFPTSLAIGPWTAGMLRLALGPGAQPLPGRVQHRGVCFDVALFTLNIPHTPETADELRGLVDVEISSAAASAAAGAAAGGNKGEEHGGGATHLRGNLGQLQRQLLQQQQLLNGSVRADFNLLSRIETLNGIAARDSRSLVGGERRLLAERGEGGKEAKNRSRVSGRNDGGGNRGSRKSEQEKGGLGKHRTSERKVSIDRIERAVNGTDKRRRGGEGKEGEKRERGKGQGSRKQQLQGGRQQPRVDETGNRAQKGGKGKGSLKKPKKSPNASCADGVDGDGPAGPGFQVTVIRREVSRTVQNFDQMVCAIKKAFPHLPVQVESLQGASFIRQARIMRRTAFLVSMHGASMANTVLLPHGASVLELMPYMWHYGGFMRICQRFGLDYAVWRNRHKGSTTYTDDCLSKYGFGSWNPTHCHKDKECRRCIRDKSITTVDVGELSRMLRAMRSSVDKFLKEEVKKEKVQKSKAEKLEGASRSR